MFSIQDDEKVKAYCSYGHEVIFGQKTSVDYIKEPTDWGVPIYKHSPQYLIRLLKKSDMTLLKEQRLLIKGADKVDFNMLFSVLIVRSR